MKEDSNIMVYKQPGSSFERIVMIESESYVLMLVYVDDCLFDIGENKYPKKGKVEAKNFQNDEDISKGLYGILWGKSEFLLYEDLKCGNWFVVRTYNNNNLIRINKEDNRYKFKNGYIVHKGSVKSSANFIINSIKKMNKDYVKYISINREEFIGTKKWEMKNLCQNERL